MNPDDAAPPSADEADRPAPPRKASPWIFVGLFALFAAGMIGNQIFTSLGPKIDWVGGLAGTPADFEAALARAAQQKKRVFAYLYADADPAAERNDREVFAQLWARRPLARVVCVRLPVRMTDALARRFEFDGQPLFLVLSPAGDVLSRVAGNPEEKEFFTYIGTIATREAVE